MSKKVTGVLAYIGIIFWLIAFLAGDKEGAKFHLNQGLVLAIGQIILNILSAIPIIGIVACIASVVLTVFAIMGIVSAVKEEEKPLPLIGNITILK
ncbi:MAG: hypothetical protein E7291_02300 [Lachnospiraceae bacterium]|nr:hypothetical protein [Lachnospiraceae bacterium]